MNNRLIQSKKWVATTIRLRRPVKGHVKIPQQYDGLCSSYIYDLVTCCCYDRMPRTGDTQNQKGYLTHGSGSMGVQGHGTNLIVLCPNTTEETER